MAERTYNPVENRLVLEWVQKYHPTSLQWRRVRLGPLPKGREEELYGILRRWADLVFKENDRIYIVEAKIRPEPGALAQLELYAKLFPQTPEFSEFKALPIYLIFLTTIEDKVVRALAADKGIRYVVYSPEWVKEYWEAKITKS